jgi:hypothetical protein
MASHTTLERAVHEIPQVRAKPKVFARPGYDKPRTRQLNE